MDFLIKKLYYCYTEVCRQEVKGEYTPEVEKSKMFYVMIDDSFVNCNTSLFYRVIHTDNI